MSTATFYERVRAFGEGNLERHFDGDAWSLCQSADFFGAGLLEEDGVGDGFGAAGVSPPEGFSVAFFSVAGAVVVSAALPSGPLVGGGFSPPADFAGPPDRLSVL